MNGSHAASGQGDASAGDPGGARSSPAPERQERSKFIHALAAFFVLPFLIAGIMPVLIAWFETGFRGGWRFGWILIAIGVLPVFSTARELFITGRGTLAPWDPPKGLVAEGLYRHVRNPMYLAVLVLIAGWGIAAGSDLLIWYWLTFAITFHLRVLLHEEPWLRRQFPDAWAAYSAAVPRWIPRLSPWTQAKSPAQSD